jgi:hypothetical protein
LLNLLAVTLAVLTLAGCGKAKGNVHGKVYYQDKPLSTGMVTFMADNKTVGTGAIQSDGSYSIQNVPVGEVIVLVTTAGAPPGKAASVTLPMEFGDPAKSQERLTIAVGDQEKDIRLK